ncbi:hypothetical protein Tco_0943887 [Tanacetum coccineum]
MDHGPQPEPNYNFQAFDSDETATAVFTFFTLVADAITMCEYSKLVQKLRIIDPQQIPLEIVAVEGKKHTFRFNFSTSSKIGAVDFTLDDVLDEADDDGETFKMAKDFTGMPPLLESPKLGDAGMTMLMGETETRHAKRVLNTLRWCFTYDQSSLLSPNIQIVGTVLGCDGGNCLGSCIVGCVSQSDDLGSRTFIKALFAAIPDLCGVVSITIISMKKVGNKRRVTMVSRF